MTLTLEEAKQLPADLVRRMQTFAGRFGLNWMHLDPDDPQFSEPRADTSAYATAVENHQAIMEQRTRRLEKARQERDEQIAAGPIPTDQAIADLAEGYGVSADHLKSHFLAEKQAAAARIADKKMTTKEGKELAEFEAAKAGGVPDLMKICYNVQHSQQAAAKRAVNEQWENFFIVEDE